MKAIAKPDPLPLGCQAIIEALPAPVFSVDRDLRYTAFNATHATVMREAYAVEIGIGDELPPYRDTSANGALLRANLDRALVGEVVVNRTWVGPEGGRRFLWTTHTPIRTGDEIVGVAVVSVDLTDTELSAQNQARLATIVESSDDAIISVGLDGSIMTWNAGAEKTFGYPAREAVGRDFWRLVPADEQEDARARFARAGGGEHVDSWETTGIAADGRRISLWAALSPFKGPDGRMVGASIIARDLTHLMETEAALSRSNAALTQMVEDILEAVGKIAEFRDPYTQGHEKGVAALGQALAREMGLSESETEAIEVAGLMHDIGKLSIPAEILTRPGRLSDIEFTLVKEHPRAGFEILKTIAFPWPVAEIVYEHHERADGSGYPRGLRAEETLLAARVLAVADVVEAMTFQRPYRPALGAEAAVAEIRSHPELYDPEVSAACFGLFEAGGLPM